MTKHLVGGVLHEFSKLKPLILNIFVLNMYEFLLKINLNVFQTFTLFHIQNQFFIILYIYDFPSAIKKLIVNSAIAIQGRLKEGKEIRKEGAYCLPSPFLL